MDINEDSVDFDYEEGANKLSPRTIVNKHELLDQEDADHCEETANYFSCGICLKVLSEPVECTQCQTAFCKECIDQWFNNSRKCPVQCNNAKYESLNPMVKEIMLKQRFFCPVKACQHSKTMGRRRV